MRTKLFVLPAFMLLSFSACSQTGSKGKNKQIKKVNTTLTATGSLYLRSIMYITTGKVDLGWYYLGDDGTLVKNPKNGVQPVNIKAEKENNLEKTGTYKISGNKITIKWATGDENTLSLKFKDGDITEMDVMGTMIRQKGLPKDFKLNSAYRGLNNGGVYNFESNGNFSRSLFENGERVEREGTYRINGNNLVLVFSDNTKELCLIALLDEDIVINTSFYSPE